MFFQKEVIKNIQYEENRDNDSITNDNENYKNNESSLVESHQESFKIANNNIINKPQKTTNISNLNLTNKKYHSSESNSQDSNEDAYTYIKEIQNDIIRSKSNNKIQ